jgi:hypothetical protein
MYKLKANTVKLLINSFANGNLELVKNFYHLYGKEVFDYVPRVKRGNYSRLIFYAFRNGHFDVINFYLNTIPNAQISDSDIRTIAEGMAHRDRFLKWTTEYSTNEKLSSAVNVQKLNSYVSSYVVSSYDIELIDQFLEIYPERLPEILKNCSTSAKGTQLRRHLQLRQLV